MCLHNYNISIKLPPLVSLKGKMTRRRTVTQPFQGDGRPCPALMEQSKPCPVKPCYRWQYGHWSPCQVQVSNPKKLYGMCNLYLQSLGFRIIFQSLLTLYFLFQILDALPFHSCLINFDNKHSLSCIFKIIWRTDSF